MLKFEDLKFDEKGLIPAIVVDAENGKVLTLAYMNKESLKISMEICRLSLFIYASVSTLPFSASTTIAGIRPFSSNFSSSIEIIQFSSH